MTPPLQPVRPGFIRLGMTDSGPLDVALDQLREKHFAITGPVGQRKTLFLLSVLKQFIMLPTDGCFFIDLGGDQAAFWILKEAAEQAGKPFYFLSLDNGHDGCSWDPIQGTPAYAADVTLAESGTASGLSLLHGEGYGRKFWGRINFKAITQAFATLTTTLGRLPSFPELARELSRMGEACKNSQHTSEAYLAAETLLSFDALTGKGSKKLDIGEAIESSAVVVVYIPSALRVESARAVATMMIWSLLVQAAHRYEQGKPVRYLHVPVDEYAQVASSRSAVDSGMVLARKWSIAYYTVFQDDSQLINPEGDLRPIIRSQCQRILFARESEEEIKELQNRSLDVLRPDKSQSLRGMSLTTSVRETREPGLTRNEILELSGVAMKAYAVLRLGDKHRDPIPFTVIPPTASPAEHTKLKNKPLPSKLPATPTLSTPASSQVAATPLAADDLHRSDRVGRLRDLYRRLCDEQSWRIRQEAPQSESK
ncbi:hypothetical protein [Botrimarina mediterranea]|uniref:AAA-like domain protein n=1 Tax=Botrimarina mediterranea TaxID=2528022 RepID=A0A518K789_9BACT|nr:hypothetical protein [Botrimarina mediterranea]QDV73658.1 hypothetical protein Spa11_18570 [Botrimarina mediterranea]QDV78248.1 hypothetical protein K2D_18550 [Planctomycetes bacterium K2D]